MARNATHTKASCMRKGPPGNCNLFRVERLWPVSGTLRATLAASICKNSVHGPMFEEMKLS